MLSATSSKLQLIDKNTTLWSSIRIIKTRGVVVEQEGERALSLDPDRISQKSFPVNWIHPLKQPVFKLDLRILLKTLHRAPWSEWKQMGCTLLLLKRANEFETLGWSTTEECTEFDPVFQRRSDGKLWELLKPRRKHLPNILNAIFNLRSDD